MEYGQVSGAIAPGIRDEAPMVDAATRFTFFSENGKLRSEDGKFYKSKPILADEYFFEIFDRPIIQGDINSTMTTPMMAAISDELAQKLGFDTAIGMKLEIVDYPGRFVEVGAIFRSFPENSSIQSDMMVSMVSVQHFMWKDSPFNWIGNDRYSGFIRISGSDVDPESVSPYIRSMQEKNQPMEEIRKVGELEYSLETLNQFHIKNDGVGGITPILLVIALAVLLTASFNYILIIISSLVVRSRDIAVRKCYGASRHDIYCQFFGESFIHIAISLILVVASIILFSDYISNLTDISVLSLFGRNTIGVLSLLIVVILLLITIVPAIIYSAIPIATAFRECKRNQRFWKLTLLLCQICSSGFISGFIILILMQYNNVIDESPGYDTDGLAYCEARGLNVSERGRLIEVLNSMHCVDDVSTGDVLYHKWASGNNVLHPDGGHELFNTADFYGASVNIFDLFRIPVVSGKGFTEGAANQIMVSRSFVKKMKIVAGWDDDVIGRQVSITEHGDNNTICGVYEDVCIGNLASRDSRPSVMFNSSVPQKYVFLRFDRSSEDAFAAVSEKLKDLFPDKDLELRDFKSELMFSYDNMRKFRDMIFIGALITLLITLAGLIGYCNDEINRRRKEIAVRIINGATIIDVLRCLGRDIIRISVPALLLGALASWYIGNKWLEQFSEKIDPGIFFFFLCPVSIFALIMLTIYLCIRAMILENPVVNIKSE